MGGATAYLGGVTAYLVGWLETDNRAISVQLNLTGTATETELVNIFQFMGHYFWTTHLNLISFKRTSLNIIFR